MESKRATAALQVPALHLGVSRIVCAKDLEVAEGDDGADGPESHTGRRRELAAEVTEEEQMGRPELRSIRR